MRNSELRRNVTDELEFEPSVNAAHIGVAVEDGVVTLSGYVRSVAERLAAEHAAKRVKGVRAIAAEIKVRLPEDRKTADDQIALRALNILQWNSVIPDNSVMVRVRDGWVTLSGQVDWQFQRTAAENAVRKLSGVGGVINDIALKKRVQAGDVKHRIEEALKRNAEIRGDAVQVSVLDDGEVRLDGFVQGWRERDAAERAAWSAPGVIKVEDRLTIV